MAFLPFLVPSTTIAPATNALTQKPAFDTALSRFACYAAQVNMTVAGADIPVFTTASNRGRFFPINIAVACTRGDSGGITAPAINMGWSASPWTDWLNGQALIVVSSSFGASNFNASLTILENATSLSAPPSTTVYVRVSTPATASNDIRTVSVLGVYLG
jgi:hypothetical protein